MKPFEIHPEADAEALAASDWYQTEAQLGGEFLSHLELAIREICSDPTAHQQLRAGLRRRRMPRFPYDVIFRDLPEAVRILAVAHHHRRSEYWKRRK